MVHLIESPFYSIQYKNQIWEGSLYIVKIFKLLYRAECIIVHLAVDFIWITHWFKLLLIRMDKRWNSIFCRSKFHQSKIKLFFVLSKILFAFFVVFDTTHLLLSLISAGRFNERRKWISKDIDSLKKVRYSVR